MNMPRASRRISLLAAGIERGNGAGLSRGQSTRRTGTNQR